MSVKPQVLLVDDHLGDISWLIDLLEHRGYQVHTETNEKSAREQFKAVERGDVSFRLAVIDIMVSIRDITDLADLNEEFYKSSRESGVRLRIYARQELGLTAEELPIVCVSARADLEHTRRILQELGIPLFSRVPQSPEESLREFVKGKLPKIE